MAAGDSDYVAQGKSNKDQMAAPLHTFTKNHNILSYKKGFNPLLRISVLLVSTDFSSVWLSVLERCYPKEVQELYDVMRRFARVIGPIEHDKFIESHACQYLHSTQTDNMNTVHNCRVKDTYTHSRTQHRCLRDGSGRKNQYSVILTY